MPEAFLIGGARTPVGRYGGALASIRPDDLAALVLGEAVTRAGIDPALIDEVILAYRFNTELFEDLGRAKASQVA